MYIVVNRDRVTEIGDFPKPDVGAPLPFPLLGQKGNSILATEGHREKPQRDLGPETSR